MQDNAFIGAESRLLTVFELLQDIAAGTETDPQVRIDELMAKRRAIDAEIADIQTGHMPMMDGTRLRERFLQMSQTAQGLLADFRQVEQNFRDLDRQVREKVATWQGNKGDMLEDILADRDAITNTDQGKSFRAFWDFLMSPSRQTLLSELLNKVLALDEIQDLEPNPRLRRVHFDWLAAGEATQQTVARLSAQLRRYLDDKAWLENHRIMQLIQQIEQHALALRDADTKPLTSEIDAIQPKLTLPFERPLYSPPFKPHIKQRKLASGDADLDASILFEQFYVDRGELKLRLRRALQNRNQISLQQLLQDSPLEKGLAELITWLAIAADDANALIDDAQSCTLYWQDEHGVRRQAQAPQVIFSR